VTFLDGLSKASTSTMLFLVGGAIPLGYFIYQFYYWHMWRGFRWWRLEPYDRGAWVLRDLDIPYHQFFAGPGGDKWENGIPHGAIEYQEEPPRPSKKEIFAIFCARLKKGDRCEICNVVINAFDLGIWLDLMGSLFRTSREMEVHMRNWLIEESVWYAVVHRTKADLLESRAEHLADIYHSLGAASASVLFAYLVYLGLLVRYRVVLGLSWTLYQRAGASCNMDACAFWCCVLASTALFVIVFQLLRSCRSTTKWNLLVLKRHFIVLYFK